MGNDTSGVSWIMYNPIRIEIYLRTLPLWRRIFARFSEKYKVTKEEYDNWFWKEGLNNF